jgi:hypothetical protein
MNATLKLDGELTVQLLRNGKVVDTRKSSKQFDVPVKQSWRQHLAAWIARSGGLVTNGGVDYLAADFAAGLTSPRISAMNFHDCGTGTNPASVTDSALQTPAGTARVAGTQSVTGNVYQSVAVIAYTSSLAITEWGIFSASTSGTLWDRRVFSVVNVTNGDSIQFTYQLTIPSGGS